MRNHSPSNLRLRVVDGSASQAVPLNQAVLTIGSAASSRLRLPSAEAQKMHALIEVDKQGKATLIDLNSGQGTRLNDRTVDRARLKVGDTIRIGNCRMDIEAMPALAERVATAISLADVAPAPSPAVSPTRNRSDAASPQRSELYRMVASAPPVERELLENDNLAVEIRIFWGDSRIAVEHRQSMQSFRLGDGGDFVLPGGQLTSSKQTLYGAGQVKLVGSEEAEIVFRNGETKSMTQAVALEQGMVVRQRVGELLFEVEGVKAVKKKLFNRGLFALASSALVYIFGSFLGHAGLLAAMATMMPPLGADADDTISQEQRYLISHYLNVSAEREQDEQKSEQLENPGEDTRNEAAGRSGARAKGNEGAAGNPTATASNRRMGVAGNAEETQLSRKQALRMASDFGMIGLLNSPGGGDPDAPTAAWGGSSSLGSDDLSARGNMFGSSLGEAFGQGGLGLTGIGEGGDGIGEGYGMGDIGTAGSGTGTINKGGFGSRLRRKYGKHKTGTPVMRMAGTSVSGRIPPGVIQRIVRNNYGRFRACYQSGLRNNPSLQGRVMVRFVIARDGRVQGASGGGDLPDNGVVSCVARSFGSLSFPRPENGIVTVSYGLAFSPTA